MKKAFLLVLVLLSLNIYAQDYTRAFGLRTGSTAGLTYKKLADEKNALEGIASFERGGVQLTLLREYFNPITLDVSDQLFFYYGVGGHLGYYKFSTQKITYNNELYVKEKFSVGIGIDAVVGLEYHVVKFPLTISFDYKPMVEYNFDEYYRDNNLNFSISVYYTF